MFLHKIVWRLHFKWVIAEKPPLHFAVEGDKVSIKSSKMRQSLTSSGPEARRLENTSFGLIQYRSNVSYHCRALRESRRALQESHRALQESRSALQESRSTLQESRSALQESRSVRRRRNCKFTKLGSCAIFCYYL